MPKKKSSTRISERWSRNVDLLAAEFPHLAGFYDDTEGFAELRIKARDDGTTLAIAKGYNGDGGPIVCFGVGYGVVAALMSIDSTIQGGRWREDKPWNGKDS